MQTYWVRVYGAITVYHARGVNDLWAQMNRANYPVEITHNMCVAVGRWHLIELHVIRMYRVK